MQNQSEAKSDAEVYLRQGARGENEHRTSCRPIHIGQDVVVSYIHWESRRVRALRRYEDPLIEVKQGENVE